jgi:hypothetical protein
MFVSSHVEKNFHGSVDPAMKVHVSDHLTFPQCRYRAASIMVRLLVRSLCACLVDGAAFRGARLGASLRRELRAADDT